MKKKVLLPFVLICLNIFAFSAISVSAETYGNLTYKIENGEVIITDCDTAAIGELVIPDKIANYPVTSIDTRAFYACSSLTDITLPNTLTNIGRYSFYGCSKLKSINIPNSVTNIGEWAFKGCRITSITIPDGITSIESSTFYECSSLTNINIPIGVTSIGNHAFYGCYKLKNITIPNSVTSLGNWAFYANTMTSITIPDSVTSIGENTFYGCTSLKNIDIPDTVKSIGYTAFYNTAYYNDVANWDDNVLYIGNHLIRAKKAVPSEYIIRNNTKTIADSAFKDCGITTLTLPDSVTNIGMNSFIGCSDLDTVYYGGTKDNWNEININSTGNDLLNKAKIIFKRIFHFVTNCENSLPDITAYTLETAPEIESAGKTFIGWYDNEALNGHPVTFPYSGESDTLYAAWKRNPGTSFDTAIEIEADKQYTITPEDPDQRIYYKFVPKLTDAYNISSKGEVDTYAYLYDNNEIQLAYGDDIPDSKNFRINYTATAEETYYLVIGGRDIGTFNFTIHSSGVTSTITEHYTSIDGEYVFITLPKNLPIDAQVILACYKDGELVEMKTGQNENKTLCFIINKEFDSAKVMVWENLGSMKPWGYVENVE